jgi:hypothetical protein
MSSGVWSTTQSEITTSPQNNGKLPSTDMHRVRSTTNYEEDDIKYRGGDCSDVGDNEYGDEDAPRHAKDELVAMMATIFLRRQQQISHSEGGRRIPPPPEKNMA